MSSIVTRVRPKGGGSSGTAVSTKIFPEQSPRRASACLNFAGRLPRDPIKMSGPLAKVEGMCEAWAASFMRFALTLSAFCRT